jgi:hypothetical protein
MRFGGSDGDKHGRMIVAAVADMPAKPGEVVFDIDPDGSQTSLGSVFAEYCP